MKLLGTEAGLTEFPGEAFWINAHKRTNGGRLVEEEIEDWRIEQCYGQLSSTYKKVAQNKASSVQLTAGQLREELRYFLVRAKPFITKT